MPDDVDHTDDLPRADDPADAALMASVSGALADACVAALGPWVVGAIERAAGPAAASLAPQAAAVGGRCAAEIGAELRALLALDIDRQRTTPLAVLRGACRYPTAVLAAAGIAAPARDPFDERSNPDDRYGLGPSTWADLGPEVGELGIAWGAAKAHLHLRRHRR